MFLAVPAVFIELQFFRRIDFIPPGDVIGSFTHRADKSEKRTLFFLCHSTWYYTVLLNLRQGVYSRSLFAIIASAIFDSVSFRPASE